MFLFAKDFFPKHELNIQTIGSMPTDGALGMLGNQFGFSALINQDIPQLQGTQFPSLTCFDIQSLPPRLKKFKDHKSHQGLALNEFVKILEVNIRFYFNTPKSAGSHLGQF